MLSMLNATWHQKCVSFVCCVAVWGCGSAQRVHTLEPLKIVAERNADGEYSFSTSDPATLFERGNKYFDEAECELAIRHYVALLEHFKESRYASGAMYNAGLCLQKDGKDAEAIPWFERVALEYPQSRDAKHALLQSLASRASLKEGKPLLEQSTRVLERTDLSEEERLEAMSYQVRGALAIALTFHDSGGMSQEAISAAEEALSNVERLAKNALQFFRLHSSGGGLRDPHFAASINFALAETYRLKMQRTQIRAGTVAEEHAQLDAKASWLLQAQREYFNTMRHRDAYWSGAAGYAVGAIYRSLHEAIVQAPVPPPNAALNPVQMQTYETEFRRQLRLKVRPLLSHAIRYWEQTLLMAERTEVESQWIIQTQRELELARVQFLIENHQE